MTRRHAILAPFAALAAPFLPKPKEPPAPVVCIKHASVGPSTLLLNHPEELPKGPCGFVPGDVWEKMLRP